MASTALMPTTTPPLRVTATGFATHVVEVRGLSKLRKKHRGDDEYVGSETFTVDGLDWKVCVNPDGEGDEQGYMGVFVELVTQGVAVWAHVSIGLVDWTTGCADPFFPGQDVDQQDPVLFDAGNGACCNWGTGKLASWRKQLRRSRYLRRDCLQIEYVVDICHFNLAFQDPPEPRLTPRDEKAVGKLGSEEDADVFVQVGGGAAIPAHSSVLDAYAPTCRRRRTKTSSSTVAASTAMRVDVDDMPRPAVEALLQFAYNGSLPVVDVDDMPRAAVEALQQFANNGSLPVVDGLSVDGYRDLFGHLLLAAKRYGMQRLSAICERVLCRCIDVESAAATLAMAHQHGFQKLEDACFEFVSDPENYGLVRTSKGYAELIGYCERSGVPACDESQELAEFIS